jgi:hypothetical protein
MGRDFDVADRIRDDLRAMGIEVCRGARARLTLEHVYLPWGGARHSWACLSAVGRGHVSLLDML